MGERAREWDATSFMVVHAALAALVSRLTASDDIAIGTPIAGRGQQVLDPLIGMFVNTLVLRTGVDAGAPFTDLVASAKQSDLAAFANADVPFEIVVDAVDPARSEAFAPFTQIWLTFDQRAVPELGGSDLHAGEVAGLQVAPFEAGPPPARVDLLVSVVQGEGDDDWQLSFVYATDLFDASTMETFAGYLVGMLAAALEDPTVAVGDLPLQVTEREPVMDPIAGEPSAAIEYAVIDPLDGVGDEVVVSGPTTEPVLLRDLFGEAATKWRPRQAVVDASGAMLTYGQLDEKSNQLARWLIAQGIGAESLVALAIGRSASLLTAIWAVAKTGGGYVPIDPDYPADRIAAMVEDSSAVLGLTSGDTGELPERGFDWAKLDDPAVQAEIDALSAETIPESELLQPVRVHNTAYVIFTSGSTGRPKGVAVTHTGLANFAAEERRRSSADEYSRVLGFASPSFDASVLEYLLATVSGGVLVYRPSEAVGGPVLQQYMMAQAITHTFLTPTVLSTLESPGLPALRVVYAGGEAVPQALKDEWAVMRRIQNLYGPTETTIGITISEPMQIGAPVYLGGPINGVGLLVLDQRLKPVPPGVPGELYVVGFAASRGYLSDAALTSVRFVSNPYGIPGDRMYRTGDIVRWRTDDLGQPVLEYAGRSDDQVKLRGLRIELGEIEAALASHQQVSSAVVIGVGGSVATALAGYVVGDAEAIDVGELKSFLAERLPAHMVPATIQVLDSLPLTPVGKLDKRALPEPVVEVGEYVAPEGPEETALAEVFGEILGMDEVSVTESFFDLGGNSLSAMRVVGRIAEVLDVEFSIADVFADPTVRGLAAAVADRAPALPPVLPAAPRPDMVPLSFAQQRMWFINRLDPAAGTYNIPAAFRLRGDVDREALRAALLDVVTRHEVLRTVFPDSDGVPYQSVTPVEKAAELLDWRVVDSVEEVFADLRTGFDVTTELPLRVRLLEESSDSLVMAVVVHHIAFDGQSFGPMVIDLLTAYAARSDGQQTPEFTALPVQYADFAVWQHEVLGSPDDEASILGRQLAYWDQALAGVPDVIELPTDRPRPPVFSSRGDQVQFAIPSELGARFDEYAAQTGSSRFMVLHAVFAALLARMSGSTDVVLGTPIDSRGARGLNALVGMFVNTLVLRTEIDPSESFDVLMARTREADLGAFAHADVPFESIVDAIDPVRSEAFSPLVQVILSVDPITEATDEATVAGVTIEPLESVETPAQMDLNLTISADEGDWTALLTYPTALFDRSTIEALGERFIRLGDGLLTDPAVPVGDVDLADEAEADRLLAASAGPSEPVLNESIADAVLAQVAAKPDAVALVTGDREFSYGEFGSRVGELARILIAAGVGPETAVGVVMDRSAELVTSVHAVMASGGQYVPIATDSPAERAEYVASTAGVQLVLVANGAEVPEFVAGLNVPVIEVDCSSELAADAKPLDPSERLVPLRASDAAYTLFTSGSTGLPKGVTIPHGAVRNFVAWFDQTVPAGDQRLLFKTPHTFDASVLELFWPLVAGQTMVIADAGGERDPQYLADVMNAADVTVVQFVPSLLAAFLDIVGDEPLLPNLRVLFSGGEALPPAVARDFRRRVPQAKVVNLFGPTEAAVYTMSAVLDEVDQIVPIGAPMANTTAFILDSRLHPVPDGVAGELYLGGVQSARGYASRPDLTAERFIADPFGEAGSRLYRTGDLVKRSSATGDLEYLGRTDFQVKLRGQRLELGEVESAIAGLDGVVHAAARVVEGPAGDQLVGYVAPASVDTNAIAVELAKQLPEYMVPTVWVALEAMPLNTAGKVDRRSLPDPAFEAVEYVAPATRNEKTVAAVYADLLGVDQVSVTESFFDAGGNSLAAMRLVARVSDALGVQVSVRDVFDAPSVRELVVAVADRAPALPPVTAVVPRPAQIPLSFAQQRMWFINRFDPDAPTYNIPAVLRISGGLDVAALRAAFADVVARHEVLRTTFPDVDGVPVQVIAPDSAVDQDLPWSQVDSEAKLFAAVSEGFDVSAQWPIRAVICPVGGDEYLFAVVAHHIAIDGESMGPLVADVLTAYVARAAGQQPPFVPLPVQFADFAIWQREVLGSPEDAESLLGRQLTFWRSQLAQLPDVLELPADRKRPAVASYRGAELGFEIPVPVAERVAAVAAEHDVTPFMVVHAALAVLLARLSATSDIAIATPIAGRGQAELDALIGMFVNTLVLRTQVESGVSFTDFLHQVRRVDLDAFGHQDVPFEAVVDAVDPVRSEAFAPLAQVMLSFDPGASVRGIDAQVEGLRVAGVPDPFVPAQFDLTFRVTTSPDTGWSGKVVYATDLFDPATATWLGDRFVSVLDELTAQPTAAVGDVALLGVGERAAALAASSGPVTPRQARGAGGAALADAVAVQVAATPDAAALVFAGRVVSYAEFGARVAVLARELIAAGVGPDVAVGVCIDRSVELLVAIHAVTAAGGQYVPVDTGAPAERARVMLETAGAGVVLVAAGTSPEPVADLVGVRLLEVDASGEVDLAVSPVADVERLSPVRPESALYTLFTSGSTGVPKGVTVSHGAVLNRLRWGLAAFPWTSGDRIILKTPYTFDVSVPELYAPLMAGATVVIAKPDGHRDPGYIADLIVESQATSVHFVPSMLSVFLDVVDREKLASLTSLRWLFASGEALPPATVKAAHEIWPGIGIHNLFGPTEAAVEVGWADVSDAPDVVTIGRPVWNTSMLVLDDRLRPVPDGVPGELYLGGVQIARGYAAAPALTAERFIADPFGEAGARLYRTGDLVRRNSCGDLEYLGRTDFQVKLRGQRIELGEIESVIAGVPGVVHAAAMVATAPAGGEFLVGYVSPASVDLDAVKAHVAASLPEYMRPSVWMLLEDVELNSAGKLDRRALPEPDLSSTAVEYVAPEGEAEEALAAVFADVLGVERVGVTESFFNIGGNSLSAMRVVARAGDALGVDLSIRDLFDHQTVRELAAAAADRAPALPPVTAVVPRPETIPLSFAQQRMWFINRLEPDAPTYNIPAALRLSGDVDIAALRSAVADVVRRHEILRTSFPDVAGVPVQVIAPEASVDGDLPWTQVGSVEEFGAAVAAGFDVSRQWPIRAVVFPDGDDYLFAVVAHHIGADGESVLPLMTDVLTAYAARAAGEVPVFVELPVQFADYAIWQREVLGSPEDADSVLGRQLAFWREALAGVPDVLELPADRPRPAIATHVGTKVGFTIHSETAARIGELTSGSGLTPFMVVHAALAVLLARLSGTQDIAIATPTAGRGQAELDALVGMFVNTLVLRAQVDSSKTFSDLLAEVRVSDLAALAHADVPFESVVEAIDPVRSEAFSPLAQVMLSFDPGASAAQADVQIAGITAQQLQAPVTPAQVDVAFTVSSAPAGQDWSGSVIAAPTCSTSRPRSGWLIVSWRCSAS
ncbi:amino acid adenylation domain-containing protein [Gordonia alkaliphila]|nr:amino acid adenylation domain-containing protein [Gordonia alkaliphila]